MIRPCSSWQFPVALYHGVTHVTNTVRYLRGASYADPPPADLVQQVQDACLALNQVQHILVVHKLNVAPVNLLTLILSLHREKYTTAQHQLAQLALQLDFEQECGSIMARYSPGLNACALYNVH